MTFPKITNVKFTLPHQVVRFDLEDLSEEEKVDLEAVNNLLRGVLAISAKYQKEMDIDTVLDLYNLNNHLWQANQAFYKFVGSKHYKLDYEVVAE
jgi:hypothetical protein